MLKKQYIIVFMLLASFGLQAQQDVHFSQFFSSPLTLNPASAGMFSGDLRGILNYRHQWASVTTPYTTMAASVDAPVLQNFGGGKFGLGLNFFKDNAGDSKLSTLNANLSLAYHLDIGDGDGSNYLSVGFQGGMHQRSMAYGALTWDEQWNGDTFDQKINTVDNIGGTSLSAFDMSTGVHWNYTPSNKTRISSGASLYHLNSPNVGFNEASALRKKLTVHGSGDFTLSNSTMGIMPNFVFVKQGPNQYIDFGGELKFILQEATRFTNYKDEMYFTIGPYLRWGDATYVVSRFNRKGMTLALSYDINLSELTAASSRNGGFEIMLGYKMDLATTTRAFKFR